ncbi:hypothetical protein BO99DRAFT_298874, partial [Aspergillus violaceofuscus CBS 115571]
ICYEFANNGNCNRRSCRYAHVQNDQASSFPRPAARNRSSYPRLSNSERDFRAWKRNVDIISTASQLSSVFREARRLIDIDVGMRQSVIQTFSTESGSRCIKKMLDQTFEGLDGFGQKQLLRAQAIPFFEVISHPEVLSSPVLEQAVGTIYNLLYGRGGASASRLFAYVSDVLNKRVKDETTASWLEVTLSVFSQMVELNSEALVQDYLRTVAKGFEEIFLAWTSSYSEASLHRQSQVHLERLLRRFEIGSSLPSIVENNSQGSAIDHGNFVSKCEPPGGRHDNDHADICQARIVPSYQEILSMRNEYLHLHDPSQWHVRGLEGLLDRNFRLLREDTIGLLRDAIHSEFRLSGQSQRGKSQQRRNVYHDVRILSVEFHSTSGVQFEVGF